MGGIYYSSLKEFISLYNIGMADPCSRNDAINNLQEAVKTLFLKDEKKEDRLLSLSEFKASFMERIENMEKLLLDTVKFVRTADTKYATKQELQAMDKKITLLAGWEQQVKLARLKAWGPWGVAIISLLGTIASIIVPHFLNK